MPDNNPPQEADEISEALEIFRAHIIDYSDRAAKTHPNVIGQLGFDLDALTKLAGGGHDQYRTGYFFEGKLVCKKGMQLSCRHILLGAGNADGMMEISSELQTIEE